MMKLRSSVVATLLILVSALAAHAQLYWDTNGATDGATDTDPDAPGTWDGATSNWNLASSGVGTGTQLWTADSAAVFSAGGDATGTFSVTVSGTQSASGVTFEDGTVTLTGGQLDLTGGAIVSVPSGSTVGRIDSVIGGSAGLNATGSGILDLKGANTYSGATSVDAGMTVRLLDANRIPDASVLTIATGNLNTAFRLNGFDETVRSISSSGATNVGTIYIGSNTLTISDQLGDSNTYTALYSATGGKIIKNGAGTLNLNNFPTAFNGSEFHVNDGVVQVSQNNVFGTNGSGSTLVVNGGTLRKAGGAPGANVSVPNMAINDDFTIDITSTSDFQFIGGSGATAGNMLITLGAANPTITVIPAPSGTSGTAILAGRVLNGSGGNRGFTKAGTGVLILGNRNNDYRGATTILEGVLRLRNQFLNLNSPTENGPGRIGDGTGTVNLSGGTLQYNGSLALNATFTAADGLRTITVTNPINMTSSSTIDYFSPTLDLLGKNEIDFIFESDSISGSAGTLSLTNSGSCNTSTTGTVGPGCTFRPTFTGDGFNFNRPIDVLNQAIQPERRTQLVMGNTSNTQTWSGAISGTGSLKRTGTGGTSVLSGANTYSGGTTVDGGTLTASGASATFGTGNVTVTGGTLSIAAGVANAIANTAMLSISGGGLVNLAAGIDDLIAALTLGGVPQTDGGTYGAAGSGAEHPSAFFAGLGVVRLPELGQPGDYNEDDIVNAADYVYWRKRNPDPTGPALPNDDSPGVGEDDYTRWVANYGEGTAGGGGANGVPEPGTIGLAIIAMFAAGACHRHRRRG